MNGGGSGRIGAAVECSSLAPVCLGAPERPAPSAPRWAARAWATEARTTGGMGLLPTLRLRAYEAGSLVEARFVMSRTPHAHDESEVPSEALVARARGGENQAFAALFLRHRGEVGRLVFRMGVRGADVDDLVQEVFVQVHRNLSHFRGDARFGTWLHRVAVNAVLMAKRAARSRPTLEGSSDHDIAPDPRLRPDDDAARRERARAFQQLLAGLADKKREAFVLHELEGKSFAEIAELTGVPVLTVRTRLFYARRELEVAMRTHPVLASLATELDPAPRAGDVRAASRAPKQGGTKASVEEEP
jgi:RNA polymerase sigma-70 factor (ECF subfamily)